MDQENKHHIDHHVIKNQSELHGLEIEFLVFFNVGPMYDMSGGVVDDDDDYDKTRRISLTQAYRRNNTVRPPLSSMGGQRRIAINNGNHPIYKVRDEDIFHFFHFSSLFHRKIGLEMIDPHVSFF
jgi:hypothetical protein